MKRTVENAQNTTLRLIHVTVTMYLTLITNKAALNFGYINFCVDVIDFADPLNPTMRICMMMVHIFHILGSTNTVFNVTVDVEAQEVTCQFLSGPVTSATCTIQYGTDPTYMNLPYTDSSTGTNVNNVTVLLSTPLQADTLYYYVVSSTGARMQGMFRSGMSH